MKQFRNRANRVYPGLYISDIQYVREHGTDKFDRVVTVCQDSVEDHISEGTTYRYFNMADGVAPKGDRGGSMDFTLFARAANETIEGIVRGEETLVHCHAGISRSASVSAAAVGAHERLTLVEALGRIREGRPVVDPHSNLRDHAKRFIEMKVGIEHDDRGNP